MSEGRRVSADRISLTWQAAVQVQGVLFRSKEIWLNNFTSSLDEGLKLSLAKGQEI